MDPKLEQTLKDAGATEYNYFEHPAIVTVEEHAKYLPDETGAVKNLFLRSKKTGKLYLVSCLTSRTVDLKELQHQLGLGNKDILRFAPEELLEKHLGVVQGAATPFAMMNDAEKVVTFIIDKDIMADPELPIHIHPLKNSATVTIKVAELKKFLDHINVTPVLF